jgi:hypothetical protein
MHIQKSLSTSSKDGFQVCYNYPWFTQEVSGRGWKFYSISVSLNCKDEVETSRRGTSYTKLKHVAARGCWAAVKDLLTASPWPILSEYV